MQITKKDVLWNYAATFLKIGSSALLLPFILRMMPPEMVGIWSIFVTITAFSTLLDFGFSPSFTRNVTYIFSGVKNLKINGFESVSEEYSPIDYGLLKGLIAAMRWLYLRMAIILFLLLITLGTYYIYTILQNYGGNPLEVYIAWLILCSINTYNLYTLYYDSLLQGKGLIKQTKQIAIIGQTIYLAIASIFIILGYGLIAIVSAQASSVFIVRWLSYRLFFTKTMKQQLHVAVTRPLKEVLKAIYPNAMKIGLTSLGGFLVFRSAIVIGSLHLSLDKIAAYGISMQLITVISGLATIYAATFQPKIMQLRVIDDIDSIKKLYLNGLIIMFLTFIFGGLALSLLGELVLNSIGSKTQLMPNSLIVLAILISLLENNHATAGGILLTKNEVPFFKAALFSGGLTILLLIFFFRFTNLDLLAMLAAPGIAQGVYQNWKWPIVVFKELKVTPKDINLAIARIFNYR